VLGVKQGLLLLLWIKSTSIQERLLLLLWQGGLPTHLLATQSRRGRCSGPAGPPVRRLAARPPALPPAQPPAHCMPGTRPAAWMWVVLCFRACVRACMRACVRAYVCACLRACVRACVRARMCVRVCVRACPQAHLAILPLPLLRRWLGRGSGWCWRLLLSLACSWPELLLTSTQ